MPLWTCDTQDCQEPAVRSFGSCTLCQNHYCSKHLLAPFHKCPDWNDVYAHQSLTNLAIINQLEKFFAKINTSALAARASTLRQGIPCSIPPLRNDEKTKFAVTGGMNYHVHIHFEDGVTWLARIRRLEAHSAPPIVENLDLQSEVATLRFLENTNIPAPKVFDFDFDNETNPVGVGYILMEKLPGQPLNWPAPTLEQRRKVMSQLADIFIELSNYPFDHIGSLYKPNGTPAIGAFTAPGLTDIIDSKMQAFGPCSTLREYYFGRIRLITHWILGGEIYALRPVNAYLIYRYLLEILPLVLRDSTIQQKINGSNRTKRKYNDNDNDKTDNHSPRKFYLTHTDDVRGDHILVDEDYNITGIIDWSSAHTTSASAAFNSPMAFFDSDLVFNGSNHLSDDQVIFAELFEEKGRQDLANHVWNGRLQQRYELCLGYHLDRDWSGFSDAFLGLRNAAGVDANLDWQTWKDVALERYKEDERLKRLLQREKKKASDRDE